MSEAGSQMYNFVYFLINGVTKNDNGDIIPLDLFVKYKRYEYDGEQNIDGYEIIAYASKYGFYEVTNLHEFKVVRNLETNLYYFIDA